MMTYVFWGLFLGIGVVLGWWFRGRRIRARSRPFNSAIGSVVGAGIEFAPGQSKALGGASPFKVVTADGSVCYEGSSGGDARRTIEKLRAGGVEWTAERDGERWDWGPR